MTVFRNGVPIDAMRARCRLCGDEIAGEVADLSGAEAWWGAHYDPVLVSLDCVIDGEPVTFHNTEE